MHNWKLVVVISFVLFLVCRIFIRLRRYNKNTFFNKNTYLFEFEMDDISKEAFKSNTLTGINTVFFTKANEAPYIKKYVISKNKTFTMLVCNYARKFSYISYFVFCYDRNHRLIDVIKVHEKNTTTTSKIVGLHYRTKFVNIVVGTVEDLTINSQIIRPMDRHAIRTAAFLTGLSIFTFLIVARDILFTIVAPHHVKPYYESMYNFLGLLVFALVALIGFFLRKRSLKKRSIKHRYGGIYEYEFF